MLAAAILNRGELTFGILMVVIFPFISPMTPAINYSSCQENVAGTCTLKYSKFSLLSRKTYYGEWNALAWEVRVPQFNCL